MKRAPSPVEIDYLAGLLIDALVDGDEDRFKRTARRIGRRGATAEIIVSLVGTVRNVTQQLCGDQWRDALSVALEGLARDFEAEGGIL